MRVMQIHARASSIDGRERVKTALIATITRDTIWVGQLPKKLPLPFSLCDISIISSSSAHCQQCVR